MQTQFSLEKANRDNFRASLEALSRPGEAQQLTPLFDSPLLAMASVLLYAEVTYFYQGRHDFSVIRAVCGAQPANVSDADYLYFDTIDSDVIRHASAGSPENPEMGATLLFSCNDSQTQSEVLMKGPGINGEKRCVLPVDKTFLAQLMEKNSNFPQGVDVFLIREQTVTGLPRTTYIEVLG